MAGANRQRGSCGAGETDQIQDDHQAAPLLLGVSKKPTATFPPGDQAEPRQRDGWVTQEGVPRLIHAAEAPFPEAEVSAAEEGPLVFPPYFYPEEENLGLSGITDSKCVEFGS